MKIHCEWKDGVEFSAQSEKNTVMMDAEPPFGRSAGMNPKELLLSGVCGCTGIDVVGLLKKYRQKVETFVIEADAEKTPTGHPAIFTKVQLYFKMTGEIEPQKALEAVRLSQTKYCGVSAMISKVVPISYSVEVNGTVVGEGDSCFWPAS